MVGIYKITSPTNKVYIGQSWDINKRLFSYKAYDCKKQTKIYNSLKKHGWGAHKFEVIMELPDYITQSVLDTWEEYWMNFYRSQGNHLLNIREAGSKGKHSKESIEKMSRAQTGKRLSDKTKKKLSIANIGKKVSEATKRKISITTKGNKNCLGNKLSEEHKRNIGIAGLGKKRSKETRKRMRLSAMGIGFKPVLQFTKDEVFMREWASATEVSALLKISREGIYRVCRNKSNTAGGFKWKYKNV